MMPKLVFLFCFINAILLAVSVIRSNASLNHVLTYWETLHKDDIKHHVVRRSTEDGGKHERKVSLTVMGRRFDIHLAPQTNLFSPDFKAFVVDGKGNKKEYPVDVDSYYTGFLEGEPETVVKAHVDNGLLTAKIYARKDHYSIEPSWRHIKEPHDYHMIAYRSSDVKRNKTSSFCPFDHHLPEGVKYEKTAEQIQASPSPYISSRKKRAPPRENTCPLLLTADYHFHEVMGQNNTPQTISYLLSLIDRVDPIYRETEWEPGYYGFGFEVKEIKVHDSATETGNDHYNSYRPPGQAWDVQKLLESYSREDHGAYCLAHLFTYQDFESGVLGLAYIGTPRSNAVGGICTTIYNTGGRQYLNTGLTTTVNWGRNVLTDEADLVTAHELGHNFGSEHDPGTEGDVCSPGNSQTGGNYLMFPASVSGRDPNNRKFSTCSLRLIAPVLRAKSPRCFQEPKGDAICGNYRVDPGEECDVGHLGNNNMDKCCGSNCRLKMGARCSDKNSACCLNCQYASAETECRKAAKIDKNCEQSAKCTGSSPDCPQSLPKSNGSPCVDSGECQAGQCIPFCESDGQISCICPSIEKSCHRCCKKTEYANCLPQLNKSTGATLLQANGRPCEEGVCISGVCESQTQDFIERLFDVFEGSTISKIGRIIKDNVVAATIIISLFIWIPCSCLVRYIDGKRAAEVKTADDWFSPSFAPLVGLTRTRRGRGFPIVASHHSNQAEASSP